MSIEILDCLKRKRDIGIKTIGINTQPKHGFHVDPRGWTGEGGTRRDSAPVNSTP